jgi:iron complex outermembrane receptor protein
MSRIRDRRIFLQIGRRNSDYVLRLVLLSGLCLGQFPVAREAIAADANESSVQSADSGGLEEIVVTARRKEERLQDVPLAVSAFTAQKLENLDLQDTTQIALFSPGLEYSGFSDGRNDRGASRQLVFRGLDLSSNSGISAGALTFLDGAPVLGGEVLASLDTERVEVLKGPQNVYFGRSTFSGAVNYVTKAIPTVWSGEAELEFAQYETRNFQASIGGPITDDFRVRFTGLTDYKGGDYRNDFNPSQHMGDQSTAASSSAFEADLSDQFTAKGYLNYEQDADGIPASANVNPNYYNCKIGGSKVLNYYCGALPQANQISTYTNTTLTPLYKEYIFNPPYGSDNLDNGDFAEQFGLQRHALSGNIHLNYTFEDGTTLSELSAYHYDHIANTGDGVDLNLADISYSPSATTVFQYGFNQLFTDQSNEVRATSAQDQPVRWTVGANSVHVNEMTEITAAFVSGGQTFPFAPTYDSIQRTTTFGFFAGGYWDILDNLTLSLEGRYQLDHESSGGSTNPRTWISKLYRSVQPRTSLDYKITPDMTAYISYASGTRPGGFNAILIGQPASVTSQIAAQTGLTSDSYAEENLNTYEIGFKGNAFDHRVNWSLDAYYGRLKNMQITQTINYVPPTGGSIGVNLVSNLGKVRIDGVEAESAWRIIPELTLTGTFAYNQTKILAYPCTACLATIGTENVNGNALPLAPTYSGSLMLDYEHPLIGDWNAFGHIDYAYRGKRWQDFENIAYIGAANYVNLRAGVINEGLTLEAFVTNLTNDTTLTGAQRLAGTVTGLLEFRGGLPDKRTFGARALYKFGGPQSAAPAEPAAYAPPPVTPPTPPVAGARNYQVFFDFNKSDLSPQAVAIVDQAAKNAGPAKATEIVVTGHTDTVGSDAYNMRLSRRRAEAVAAELEKQGIKSSEIEIVAKGKKDLLVPTADGVREPQNRRVQIVYQGGLSS